MTIGKYTVEFWWLPPKGRRGFFVLWGMPYDGIMHFCVGLWVVHIGAHRPCVKEDYE